MKRKPLSRALLPAVLLAGLTLPGAAWAMRCGTRLVVEGDSDFDVRAKCGEPTEISRRYILRPAVVWLNGRPVQVGNGPIEVPVETWTYNLGPLRFMQQLRIEDGKVVRIDTLGYGYR